jgi:hypothetical protein
MDYLDSKLIESFRLQVQQSLQEGIEFAVNYERNRGERNGEVLRQTAHDALSQLFSELIGATSEAYRRSPLQKADDAAISALFDQVAVRARVKALTVGTVVDATTAGTNHYGTYYGSYEHEGQESVLIGEDYVPVVSIKELRQKA